VAAGRTTQIGAAYASREPWFGDTCSIANDRGL